MSDRKTDLNAAQPTAEEARKAAALLQKIAEARTRVSRRTLADAVESLSGGERPPDEHP